VIRYAGFALITMSILAMVVLTPRVANGAELRLGILGGGNSTVYAGDTPPKGSFKSQRSHQFGGVVDVVLSPTVVLSGQVMSMTRTPVIEIEIDKENPDLNELIEIETRYIVVPLMVQYVFGEKTTRFYLTVGGEVSWLQSATLREEGLPEEDITDRMNSMDAAVDLGAGVRSKIGPVHWFIELRYTYGMVDLAEENITIGGKDLEVWKSRSSQLLIGLTIPVLGS